jgi:hypothetical protein
MLDAGFQRSKDKIHIVGGLLKRRISLKNLIAPVTYPDTKLLNLCGSKVFTNSMELSTI